LPTKELFLNFMNNKIEVPSAPVSKLERESKVSIKLISCQNAKGMVDQFTVLCRSVLGKEDARLILSYFLPR